MIVGRKDAARRTICKELIAWIKANPGKVTVGNAGIGSPGHVSSVFFQNTIGGQIQSVPYRSAGPASQDLLAGNIDMMMDTAATSGGHVRNGLLKAFAMTANKRSPVVPDVPTIDEAGLPGFHFYFWHALWVPKGTPKDVIAKLNDALVKARNDPATHKRLADIGQEFFPADMKSPEALGEIPEGRDREVVAGHQGRRHQGAVTVSRKSRRGRNMRKLIGAVALAALAGLAGAQAQTFPSRPITLVVPFPPGGSTDIAARIMAEKMRPILGQPVIIENVGGAGGSIAVGRVARAAPDGYTIDIGQWDTHVGSIIYNINYDLQKDFEPIGLISVNPQLLVAQEESAGQRPQRAGRLDEGQSRQGQVRQPERAPRRSPAS